MPFSVAIIGGGPAGAGLAVELQRLGINVAVVAKPRQRQCFEGMSERTAALLDRFGFACARQVLRPPGLRQAFWNGAQNRHNVEHLVERSALDRALLADLRRLGVPVVEIGGRACQRVDTGWRIATDAGEIEAAFLVEARGRAAPVSAGTSFRGPGTVAVGRLFQAQAGEDATAVMPFAQGWAWMARGSDGIASVQFTIDAAQLPPGGRAGLTVLHEDLLAQVEGVAQWLSPGARPLGLAFARDCTSYLRRQLAEPGYLRVGDAACGLDPLSGQGVFLALSGALSAAAVVNTCLNRPGDAGLALTFHRQRVERQFFEKVALGRGFYGLEQRWTALPFWLRRSSVAVPETVAAGTGVALGCCLRPVLEHGWVVEREVFVTPDQPLGVWRVDDVPVVDLARSIQAEDGFSPAAYAARHGFDPVGVARAAAWLAQAGVVGGGVARA